MAEQLPQISSKPSAVPGWVKWHDWTERAFVPTTAWVCEASGAGPGDHILDLGSGTGLPALALAKRVGPSGRVIASDVSKDMLEATAANARHAGLENLVVKEMDADHFDLPDAAFDVVTCSFMLMFRPDPARVVAEARRVLKPGGRLVVVVWDAPEANPFFTTVFEPVGHFVSLPPSDPRGPGTFRLAGRELEPVLKSGSFSDVTLEALGFEIAFESLDEHWGMFSEMAPPVKAAREALAAPELERLRAAIAKGLTPYRSGSGVVLPARAVCGLAMKT